MSPELASLLSQLESPAAEDLELRLQFGLICVQRVAHLIEHEEVQACLARFQELVGQGAYAAAQGLAPRAAELANQHQGSKSLDGVGHAAVSATYALAMATTGRARQAAEYAAYASVYGQGGYGATSELSSFLPEYEWQVKQLQRILGTRVRERGTT